MNKRTVYLRSFSCRWLWLFAALSVLIFTCGCEEFLSDYAGDIKKDWGIDIYKPEQSTGSALYQHVFGDPEKADALDIYNEYRRAQHKARADKLLSAGNYDDALEEYQLAIKWAPSTTNREKNNLSNLHASVAECYEQQLIGRTSLNDADLQQQWGIFRTAGKSWEACGNTTTDPEQKWLAYAQGAYDMYQGGNKGDGSRLLEKAKAAGMPDDQYRKMSEMGR